MSGGESRRDRTCVRSIHLTRHKKGGKICFQEVELLANHSDKESELLDLEGLNRHTSTLWLHTVSCFQPSS